MFSNCMLTWFAIVLSSGWSFRVDVVCLLRVCVEKMDRRYRQRSANRAVVSWTHPTWPEEVRSHHPSCFYPRSTAFVCLTSILDTLHATHATWIRSVPGSGIGSLDAVREIDSVSMRWRDPSYPPPYGIYRFSVAQGPPYPLQQDLAGIRRMWDIYGAVHSGVWRPDVLSVRPLSTAFASTAPILVVVT
jgi:hypothetical protein